MCVVMETEDGMAQVIRADQSPGFDIDQSAIDQAPQCPTCYGHTMRAEEDRVYVCPGCHERAIVFVRMRRSHVRDSEPRVFRGRLGDEFAILAHA